MSKITMFDPYSGCKVSIYENDGSDDGLLVCESVGGVDYLPMMVAPHIAQRIKPGFL